MELANWLNTDINKFPILGKDSFETFLKVCKEFSYWALDDIGLANRANSYKIWVCWIKPEDISKIKSVLERYSSMKLLTHYYNINIVERNKIGLYVKLDYEQNKWQLSYGITNNKKLFMVGQFDYTFNTKLPELEIIKYITDTLSDFDPREHLLLYKIKQDSILFDPGYCKRTDPQIINKEVVISCYELGLWTDRGLVPGESLKYIEIFKQFVMSQSWSLSVHLVLRPRSNKWIDFIIQLK